MRIIKVVPGADIDLYLTMLKTVQIGGHKIKLTKYIYSRALELGESTVPELYFKIMGSLGGNIDLPLIPQINKTYRIYLSRLLYLIKKGGLKVESVPDVDEEYRELMRLLNYCLKYNIPQFEAEYRDEVYRFRVLNLRDILKHSYLSFFLVAERLATPQHAEEIAGSTGLTRGLVETYLKVLRMYGLVKMTREGYVFKSKEDYLQVRMAGEAKKQRVLDKLTRYVKAIKLYYQGYNIKEIARATSLTPQYVHRLLNRKISGNRILLYAERLTQESMLSEEDYDLLRRFLSRGDEDGLRVEEEV